MTDLDRVAAHLRFLLDRPPADAPATVGAVIDAIDELYAICVNDRTAVHVWRDRSRDYAQLAAALDANRRQAALHLRPTDILTPPNVEAALDVLLSKVPPCPTRP